MKSLSKVSLLGSQGEHCIFCMAWSTYLVTISKPLALTRWSNALPERTLVNDRSTLVIAHIFKRWDNLKTEHIVHLETLRAPICGWIAAAMPDALHDSLMTIIDELIET